MRGDVSGRGGKAPLGGGRGGVEVFGVLERIEVELVAAPC